MSIRQQLGLLLWQHGVENDAVLDALDWKMRKIMSDTILSLTVERDQLLAMLDKYEDIEAERDRLREALEYIANWRSDQTSPQSEYARAALAKEFANDGITDDSETLRARVALAKEEGQ